jgi:hypothetical protein
LLLVSKGVFTLNEYATAMADAAEREKQRYEDEVSKAYGAKITLG